MTYGELKKQVLNLIFSYQIAGDPIELSYNNQADYVAMIPGFLNKVQSEISQIKKITEIVMLSDLPKQSFGAYDMYYLPEDCIQLMNGGLIKPNDYEGAKFLADRFSDYKIIGEKKLLVPKGLDDRLLVEYWKRPVTVSDNVQDSYELENSEEVNQILPFYIAAYCVLYDDSFRYSALKNEYESSLQRLLINPVYIEMSEIDDAYNGFGGTY